MFVTIYILFVAAIVLASIIFSVWQWRRLRHMGQENEERMRNWEHETFRLLMEAMQNTGEKEKR